MYRQTPGIFILEVHNDVMNRKSKKGIRSLGFEQNIGAYDKYAFCALASSKRTVRAFCVRIWQRPLLLSAGMMWNYVRYVWRREWSS